MERAHRHHRRVERMDVARHDGLQRHDDGSAADDGVQRLLRLGAVAADTVDRDARLVDRRHDRPFAQRELAEGQVRLVVEREDGVAGEFLEQPLLHHDLRPAEILLRRLEDQVHRAVEIAPLGNRLGRAEQHGGVAVMTAGMHLAGVLLA